MSTDNKLAQALRAAEDWISRRGHGDNCYLSDHYDGDPGNQCNCGKTDLEMTIDAALAAHDAREGERGGDVQRDVLLDQSLRERAHQLRREACSAWSAVAVPCDHIDEAKCQYAAAQEARLKSVIDELADLSAAQPQPSVDSRGMAFVDGIGWVVRCTDAIKFVVGLATERQAMLERIGAFAGPPQVKA